MKKPLLYVLSLVLALAVGATACWLIMRDAGRDAPEPVTTDGGVTNSDLASLALDIARDIKNGDFERLAARVHPEYGLVLSPSATVNLSSNQCFTAKEVEGLKTSSRVYIWGMAVDSVKPIELTPADYFAEYVFDFDYTAAPVIGVDYVVRTGNSLENVPTIFPSARFVDLCNPGKGGSDNPDWSILRVVFEEYDGELRLAALIHSEYTI